MEKRTGFDNLRGIGYLLLFTATLAGAWAVFSLLYHGHSLMNTTQIVPWGLLVALYVFFLGLSAGSFFVSTLAYVFRIKSLKAIGPMALLQALCCFLIGGFLIVIDLGHPLRIYKVFFSMNLRSVMAWMGVFYTFYIVIVIAKLYLVMKKDPRRLKTLGIIGIPAAIFVSGGVGMLFAVAKARPNWFGGLFPIISIITALTSGGALLTFLAAFFLKGSYEKRLTLVYDLARITAGILCFDLLLLFSEIFSTFYGGIPHELIAWRLMLFGPYGWGFWILQLFLGTLVPIAIIMARRTNTSLKWLGIAGFLICLGVLSMRINIIIPPQINPPFESLPGAFTNPRNALGYFPSMNELMVAVFAFALWAWLFIGSRKLLSLESEGEKSVEEDYKDKPDESSFSRRDIVKTAAVLGSTPILTGGLASLFTALFKTRHLAELDRGEYEYTHNDPDKMIFTVCLGCNTGCPTKVKIQNGAIVKIDGSPYTPWTRVPHIPYKTPVKEAARIAGAICPKGQAGMMTIYDPYRIQKVLKREGPRGSMKWQTIEFHQAIDEIVNGGRLFAHVAGEENRQVEGISEIWKLRDPRLAGEMGKATDEIWGAKTQEEKKKKVAEFKEKFKDHLHMLIDPDHPDLGPKNNQFLWVHGRLKGGRSDFFTRFVKEGLGSVNFHGHTTVCQGSLYFTGKAMSEQYGFDEKKEKTGWHGGEKFFWQADQSGSQFILFIGSSPFEANYPPLRAPNITDGISTGRLKIAVVDPRFSKTASKAWKWIPIKPGTEAALILGMIRWILENDRHDRRYLSNANKAASKQDGEPTWSNACWLVKMKGDNPAEFLRASDIGLPKEKQTATIKDKTVVYDFDPFMVLSDGKLISFDPNDEKAAIHGDLLVDVEIKGHKIKTPLSLITDEARKHTIEEWAAICGIGAQDIIDLAHEFTSHGKKAVADGHRGLSQHTNGFYNCLALNTLNLLIGNYDWHGGFVKASAYDTSGGKAGGPFDFKKGMHPDKAKPFGLGILRERKFEETTLFTGAYPAKRPWFPNATDVYQELLPSCEDAYPYPIKALLLYMGTPGYSVPAGHTQVKILADTQKIPLFIASDIVIGESSMYADYIIPDLSFYERWEFHGSHPNNIWKVQPVRQPAIAPITDTVKVFGEEMPISLESVMLAIAEKLGLPGFGPDGFGKGEDFRRPDDFYLRCAANIAFGEKEDGSEAVSEASEEELNIFMHARQHLPKSVFDMEKWRKAAGPHWRRVVYVLNRGGRYQEYEKAFDGDQVKNRYAKQVNIYSEKVAKSTDSMTGRPFVGIATYIPIADSLGRSIANQGDRELLLVTYREIFHTKSRTPGNVWLKELYPENSILINKLDSDLQGLKTGMSVRIVSDSNPEGVWDLPNFGRKPMVGRIKVTQGIRPGVIAFSLGHGHWAYGTSDVWVDGKLIAGDPGRGAGIHANAAMMVDPQLKNVCLQDLVGGSASFYDSVVRLEKI